MKIHYDSWKSALKSKIKSREKISTDARGQLIRAAFNLAQICVKKKLKTVNWTDADWRNDTNLRTQKKCVRINFRAIILLAPICTKAKKCAAYTDISKAL